MATPSKARLLVGNRAHDAWTGYHIDSNLLKPADDWEFSVFATRAPNDPSDDPVRKLPDFLFEGAAAKVMIDNEVILDGVIGVVDERVHAGEASCTVTGRDRGATLVDCSAPLLSMQTATLAQIITNAVMPLGIAKIDYRAEPASPRLKVHTEPGQTVWEWLQAACEANAVWPWFAPNGTLVIGQPDYTVAPVATLIQRQSGQGNNVLWTERHGSIDERFSQITVLGQAAGTGEDGVTKVTATAYDALLKKLNIYRPRVLVDGNCETVALAQHRAEKAVADGILKGSHISVAVKGHRARTSQDQEGPLWEPGQRVLLMLERYDIETPWYLISRAFKLDATEGAVTLLHFIQDGSWMLNLPKVKGKRRNDAGKHNLHYVKN